MDVDDTAAVLLAKARAENLHVPRQHNHLNVVLFSQPYCLPFCPLLCLSSSRVDRKVEEGDVVRRRQRRVVWVVRHNERNGDGQRAARDAE